MLRKWNFLIRCNGVYDVRYNGGYYVLYYKKIEE